MARRADPVLSWRLMSTDAYPPSPGPHGSLARHVVDLASAPDRDTDLRFPGLHRPDHRPLGRRIVLDVAGVGRRGARPERAAGLGGDALARLPPGNRPWDKRRAIQDWFTEHGVRPLIWVDDDRRIDTSGRPWARRLPPSLLIRPQKAMGLTPAHLDAMERWLDRLGAAGSAGR